ncbi:uncharacterized protein E0L32_006323 [Thyridium curvatum]|uniref:Heterokaryon incompatibility domain-containing protein n=1 Tax=Thyridium curvatum TaxID=1093900 RepID=A0A507B9S3_9PEZI|nr:uncharacterized protein E0L32_006323 [Thyridium curvatum]TPX13350.1 hypothetical protein E0L32_006323 [Thyridium curvatum]
MALPYSYVPLPPGSFRLLRLTSKSPGTTPDCELATFPLSEAPEYNALSYCWETMTRDSPIKCNGKEMVITFVLEEALRSLAVLDRGDVEWLWIDQVCINQSDDQERGTQVDMMRDIYKISAGTIIWLGGDIPNLAAGAQLMDRLSQLYKQDLSPNGGRKRRRYTMDEYRSIGLPRPADISWEALRRVLIRPWFVRSWVIQEAALSRTSPRVKNILPTLRSLKLFNELIHVGLPWDTATLLNKAIRFKASDPRDRIYSLVALTGEAQESHALPAVFRADYGRPVRDVFRDVTRHIIASSGKLTILTMIRYVPNWDQFPSWVVDFAGGARWERLSYFTWGSDSKGLNCVTELSDKASGDVPLDIHHLGSGDILTLQGLRIDALNLIYGPASGIHTYGIDSDLLEVWKIANQILGARCTSVEELARTVMITLSANWNLDNEVQIADQPLSHFWAYLWNVYDISLAQADLEENRKKRADIEKAYLNILPVPRPDVADETSLFRHHLDAAGGRRVFFTKALLEIGLGPCFMEVGDVLCVLFGAATPIILRPDGSNYRFVGECYVHSLMKGEAVDDWQKGTSPAETFTII